MHTRLTRPHPFRLALAATLGVVGIAGACSQSAPDAPLGKGVVATAPNSGTATPVERDPQSTRQPGTSVRQTPDSGPTRLPEAILAARRARQARGGMEASPARQSAPSKSSRSSKSSNASTPAISRGPFFEFQVETPVRQIPGSGLLRYPDDMLKARREGEVLAQFVVNAGGVADTASFQALKSSDHAFTDAVRKALPAMRFRPALIGGQPVPQLVQQPFTFALSRSQRS